MSRGQGDEGAARVMWETLWRSLTAEERREAALAYVRAAERFAPGREAIISVLSAGWRTRPSTVARWAPERRAERLARGPSLDPPLIAAVLARWLVEAHGPLVRRFLDLAGVAHRGGEIDAAKAAHGACDPERLRTAVRTVGAEFPPRDVALFLDALEGQRVACLEGLAAARRPPEGPTTQGAAS